MAIKSLFLNITTNFCSLLFPLYNPKFLLLRNIFIIWQSVFQSNLYFLKVLYMYVHHFVMPTESTRIVRKSPLYKMLNWKTFPLITMCIPFLFALNSVSRGNFFFDKIKLNYIKWIKPNILLEQIWLMT